MEVGHSGNSDQEDMCIRKGARSKPEEDTTLTDHVSAVKTVQKRRYRLCRISSGRFHREPLRSGPKP